MLTPSSHPLSRRKQQERIVAYGGSSDRDNVLSRRVRLQFADATLGDRVVIAHRRNSYQRETEVHRDRPSDPELEKTGQRDAGNPCVAVK
jgi:hypothetical protein